VPGWSRGTTINTVMSVMLIIVTLVGIAVALLVISLETQLVSQQGVAARTFAHCRVSQAPRTISR
jgi:hypothetical protein